MLGQASDSCQQQRPRGDRLQSSFGVAQQCQDRRGQVRPLRPQPQAKPALFSGSETTPFSPALLRIQAGHGPKEIPDNSPKPTTNQQSSIQDQRQQLLLPFSKNIDMPALSRNRESTMNELFSLSLLLYMHLEVGEGRGGPAKQDWLISGGPALMGV